MQPKPDFLGPGAASAFSRERMTPEDAAALDEEIRSLVRRHAGDMVEQEIVGEIVWGRPIPPPP